MRNEFIFVLENRLINLEEENKDLKDRLQELEKAFCHAVGLGERILTDQEKLEIDLATGDGVSYKRFRKE